MWWVLREVCSVLSLYLKESNGIAPVQRHKGCVTGAGRDPGRSPARRRVRLMKVTCTISRVIGYVGSWGKHDRRYCQVHAESNCRKGENG